MKKKVTAVAAALAVIMLSGATLHANWSESFNAGKFDLSTWQFYCWPQLTGTFTQTIKPVPDANSYLSMDETSSLAVGGSAFGMGFGTTEKFTDVRLGAVVNVTGDASHNHHGLGARASYFIDNGQISGYPGLIASAYVMHINWENGPANLIIEIEKVVNLENIMRSSFEVVVPGLNHARSYYAELDVVGSGPVYVTGSLYEYKGGPLVAKTSTMVDTSGNDSWEDPAVNDAVFTNGLSGIFAQNQEPAPPGYHTTFDSVFSVSDGPAAVNPNPPDGAQGVSVNSDLSWVEAAFATSRQLWFGKQGNMQQVVLPPGSKTYKPGLLEFGQTYQWRVDEVGPAGIVKGHLWTFTTGCLVVDNFESYADDTQISAKWPHNIPGDFKYVFLQTDNVYQGAKAMRFEYQNQYEPFITETTRTFDTPQDWTLSRVSSLSLAFRGQDDNTEQSMYIKLVDASGNTATATHPYIYAVQTRYWQGWDIDLAQFSSAGVNLAKVKKLTIGVGSGTKSTQADKDRDAIYIDSIQLCPLRCINPAGLDLRGDLNGDCTVNFIDLAIMAAGWLNNGSSLP